MRFHRAAGAPCLAATAAILLAASVLAQTPAGARRIPRIDGEWWTVATNPDLGVLGSDEQEPVDFGVWQAADGTWQLWSCIRKTREPGKTRLFYGWEGVSLETPYWKPMGIRMQGNPEVGETRGGLQAPHVTLVDGVYHMLYGDWQHIALATSADGKLFQRRLQGLGRVVGMFDEGPHANTRDPMVIRIGDLYHCYYVATIDEVGGVYCRTSPDLVRWSESTLVSRGGHVVTEWWHAECPHVVSVDGYYYLFLTKNYMGVPETNVFRSRDPLDFGIDGDEETWVGSLPAAAPELVHHEGEWFIAALRPELDGIRVARLRWDRAE
jgi:hypothetical protein